MARIVSVRALKARQHSNPERRQALAISKAVAIEALEVRRLFNTFVVTNTGDNGGVNPAQRRHRDTATGDRRLQC